MQTLESELRAAGLDVFGAFDVARWHDPFVLDPWGQGGVAVVVGNSKALWPVFLGAARQEPNPLDRYVERVVGELAVKTAARLGCRVLVHWGHRAPPVPIQRVAELAGVARLGPAWLSVHPVHGPWFGLRAVIVFDTGAAAPGRAAAPDFCTACEGRPCVPAMNAALALGPRASWRDWLAARDACPVGRDARYDEPQLLYHYTKNAACLHSGVKDEA